MYARASSALEAHSSWETKMACVYGLLGPTRGCEVFRSCSLRRSNRDPGLPATALPCAAAVGQAKSPPASCRTAAADRCEKLYRGGEAKW